MYFSLGKGFALLILLLNVSQVVANTTSTVENKNNMGLATALVKHTKLESESGNLSQQDLTQSYQAPIELITQPEQCVTLRQGRSCFATIHFQWQSTQKESLCLFQANQVKALICWKNTQAGDINIEFEASENTQYQLRTLAHNKVVAQSQIKVSWLHKRSSRKRRWRLF